MMIVIIYSAVSIPIVVHLLRGRRGLLWAVGFAQQVSGVVFFAGVSFSWSKIMFFIMLAMAPVYKVQIDLRKFPGIVPIAFYLGYLFILAIWYGCVDHQAEQLRKIAKICGWGLWQTDYRYFVQYVSAVTLWLTPVLIYFYVAGKRDFELLARGFIVGAIVSISVGLYQSLSQVIGLPWIDWSQGHEIIRGNLGIRENIQNFKLFSGITIARLFGLGGEPKHTAALSIFAIILILTFPEIRKSFNNYSKILILLIIGIFLTFSTSGWIALVAIYLYFVVKMKNVAKNTKSRMLFIVLVLMLTFYFNSEYGKNIFENRVESRISPENIGTGISEYKDQSAIKLFFDDPLMSLVGYGPGGVDFFLIKYVPKNIKLSDNTVSPTYLITRVVGDSGVLGLFLILWIISSAKKKLSRGNSINDGGSFLEAGVIASLLVPMLSFGSFLILLSGFVAYNRASFKNVCSQHVNYH